MRYNKALVAAAAAAVVVIASALTGRGVTPEEWEAIVVAILSAAGVWAVPNRDQTPVDEPPRPPI